MIKYDNIIIDSNLWYTRNHFTHENIKFKVGDKVITTGGIYGFLKSVSKWKKLFAKENTKFYFLFDNAKSKSNLRQKIIDPTYKLNRFKRPDSFYRSIDYLRLVLLNQSEDYTIVYGTGYEADDIVPYILKKIPDCENSILVSEDLDWSRLISENVHVFMKNDVWDIKKFINKFNFKPTVDSVTLYKAIKGDASDEIPIGVPNIPVTYVEKLCNEYKDVYEILENLDLIDYLSEKTKKKFIQNKSRLNLNHQLISFLSINEKELDEYTIQGKFKPESLKILYKSLNFSIDSLEKIDRNYYNYIVNEKKNINPVDLVFSVPKMKR